MTFLLSSMGTVVTGPSDAPSASATGAGNQIAGEPVNVATHASPKVSHNVSGKTSAKAAKKETAKMPAKRGVSLRLACSTSLLAGGVCEPDAGNPGESRGQATPDATGTRSILVEAQAAIRNQKAVAVKRAAGSQGDELPTASEVDSEVELEPSFAEPPVALDKSPLQHHVVAGAEFSGFDGANSYLITPESGTCLAGKVTTVLTFFGPHDVLDISCLFEGEIAVYGIEKLVNIVAEDGELCVTVRPKPTAPVEHCIVLRGAELKADGVHSGEELIAFMMQTGRLMVS